MYRNRALTAVLGATAAILAARPGPALAQQPAPPAVQLQQAAPGSAPDTVASPRQDKGAKGKSGKKKADRKSGPKAAAEGAAR